jgi:hypothetical protein
MMNATGSTVVQLLSGSIRQMLLRSGDGVSAVNVCSTSRRSPSDSFHCLWTAPEALLCRQQSAYHIDRMIENDRRHFQRMKLARPILAGLRGESALILDIGINGGLLEHRGTARLGEHMKLAFKWQGKDVKFDCEVTRTQSVMNPEDTASRQVSHSAVIFINPAGESLERLQEMMATFVGRILAAQRANASADSEESAILPQLGEAQRSRTHGFVAYLFDGKTWIRRYSRLSDQPRNGFTVAAYEDEEELETLCRTYETADEEGRRLIRLVAELSAASVKK